jgi:bifunctional DNA-binding transcriptional regulator/antitoxin component of YhaV-PrlF toxin-antitoxin module
MMDRLRIAPGDRLFAIETKDGVLLTPYDPAFDDAMQAFEKVRRQYRNTLKKLSE